MQAYLNTLGVTFSGLMFESTSEGFLMSILDPKSDIFLELEKSKFIKTTIKLTTAHPKSYVECIPNENLYYLTKRAEFYISGKEEYHQENANFSLFAVIMVPIGVPHYFKRATGVQDGFVYKFCTREPFVSDYTKDVLNE